MSKKIEILNDVLYDGFLSRWKSIGPPWRPSLRECLFADVEIKKIRKDEPLKALVLGVTPEWRDVLHMNGVDAVLCDAKESMMKSMTSVCYYEPVKEIFIESDWLSISSHFKENEFDIVISDRPQDNIPYEKWNILWGEIKKVLNPNGILLLGIANNDFTNQKTFEEMLSVYRNNPLEFKYHYQRLIWLYDIATSCGAYDKELYKLNFEILRKYLVKEGREFGATDEELDGLWFVRDDVFSGSFGDFIETLPPLETTLRSLEKSGFKLNLLSDHKDDSFMDIKRMACLTK
jgi:SAM-dependent methyltransferase